MIKSFIYFDIKNNINIGGEEIQGNYLFRIEALKNAIKGRSIYNQRLEKTTPEKKLKEKEENWLDTGNNSKKEDYFLIQLGRF